MRQVRLKRNAFINDSYCAVGSVVAIGDDVEMAPFMSEVVAPVSAPVPQDHAVTVSYDETGRKIAITIDGVVTRLDHAELKLRMD